MSRLPLTLALCLGLGCTGGIGNPGAEDGIDGPDTSPGGSAGTGGRGTPGASGGSSADGKPGTATPGAEGAGALPLRRLATAQYVNTVRDLLGEDAAKGLDLSGDTENQETKFIVSGAASDVEVGRWSDAALKIGGVVAPQLAKLLGCTPGAGPGDACVRGFVTSFGRRAYRRPLEPSEVDALVAYGDQVRKDLGLAPLDAARVVLQAMLQSPHFLYHWEAGLKAPVREGELVRLSQHQVAARLSYFLWNSMPDAALFAAADGGKLGTPATIEVEARRMIASDKFRAALGAFHAQWLRVSDVAEVTKDVTRFPDHSPALMADLATETRLFVESNFFDGGTGRFDDLLTASHGFVNARVAGLYGLPTAGEGETWKRVDLAPGHRLGVFSRGAFLARKALPYSGSPVKRGFTVREQVLCDRIPLLADIVVTPPTPKKGSQTRELYDAHLTEAKCKGCHSMMDPLGFAFENFDGIGKYRTEEEGRPVDASGSVQLPDGKTITFKNAEELLPALAKTDTAALCFSRQWFRFAVGRLEAPAEEATLARLAEEFGRGGRKVPDLLAKLAATRAFTYRTPVTGEAN